MIWSPTSWAVQALTPKDVMPKWCLAGRNGSPPSVSSSISSSRATAYLVIRVLPSRTSPTAAIFARACLLRGRAGGMKRQLGLQDKAPLVEHGDVVERGRGADHDAVEMHGDGHGAADAGARPERDVRAAEHLLVFEDVAGQASVLVGADAELGEVASGGAVLVEQVQEPLVAIHQPATGALQTRGGGGEAGARQCARDDPPVAAGWGDEALSGRQVAPASALGQLPIVRDPLATGEIQRQVC